MERFVVDRFNNKKDGWLIRDTKYSHINETDVAVVNGSERADRVCMFLNATHETTLTDEEIIEAIQNAQMNKTIYSMLDQITVEEQDGQ